MSSPTLILIGAGGHARSCIDVIEQQDQYKVAGLIGLEDELHSRYYGYKVIGNDRDLPEFAKNYDCALITLGQIRTAEHRFRLYENAIHVGFQFPVIIAPTAYVSKYAILGAGTIIMHGAIVNAGARVGDNCIINTRAIIEHDAIVGDHCHISTGTILNGGVAIGFGSFIGSGSVIKENLTIGQGSLVGMGLTVRYDLNDKSYYVGHDKL
jgi:sugar O-acyltransferase (sialic acid O-acetyltransferase NeuD family)